MYFVKRSWPLHTYPHPPLIQAHFNSSLWTGASGTRGWRGLRHNCCAPFHGFVCHLQCKLNFKLHFTIQLFCNGSCLCSPKLVCSTRPSHTGPAFSFLPSIASGSLAENMTLVVTVLFQGLRPPPSTHTLLFHVLARRLLARSCRIFANRLWVAPLPHWGPHLRSVVESSALLLLWLTQ